MRRTLMWCSVRVMGAGVMGSSFGGCKSKGKSVRKVREGEDAKFAK